MAETVDVFVSFQQDPASNPLLTFMDNRLDRLFQDEGGRKPQKSRRERLPSTNTPPYVTFPRLFHPLDADSNFTIRLEISNGWVLCCPGVSSLTRTTFVGYRQVLRSRRSVCFRRLAGLN